MHKNKPRTLEYNIMSSTGKSIIQSTPNLRSPTSKTLDNGFKKSALDRTPEEVKKDPYSIYFSSQVKGQNPKNKRSIFVKESLDEIMKPLIKQEMRHDPDDLTQYIPYSHRRKGVKEEMADYYHAFVPSDHSHIERDQRVLRPIRSKELHSVDCVPQDLTKSVLQNPGFMLGISAKTKNETAQSMVMPKGLKTEVYQGDDLRAPLFQRELREINAMNTRYSASRAEQVTMREEMDKLAKSMKGRDIYDF